MRNNRFRRLPPWTTCCLCLLVAALAGCGDYCLFCNGQGGGGGGNGTEEICDNFFSGLEAYQAALNLQVVDLFEELRVEKDRLSLAVVPKGMSFQYGSNHTVDPGDVILADQQASDIYVYEFGTTQTRRSLGLDVGEVSGVALLHYKIDEDTDGDLLFFTVEADNKLYIHNLKGSSNPLAITNQVLSSFFGGNDFFEFPTALAVSADAEKAVVFVLNDNGTDSSVRRISMSLPFLIPDATSLQTIATMKENSRRLVDLAFFNGTNALFVSKRVEAGIGLGGWVYRIADASDRGNPPVNLDSATPFIDEFVSFTGLEVAFMDKQGTTADLLVLKGVSGLAGQFDIRQQGTAKALFDFSGISQYPLAIAYDCTNERLVMTDVPPYTSGLNRNLFQAFPSQ